MLAGFEKPVAKRHHMVSGTLSPLYTVFGLKLGCSGAAALIGDKVLYNGLSVHPFVRPPRLAGSKAYLADSWAQLRPKNCIKRGKGTADHMMPLGNWLLSDK